jgi:hypothetical protein
VDRRASDDGTCGHLNHRVYRQRKLGREWTISRTDPFLLNVKSEP